MLMSNVNVSEGTFMPTVKHGDGGGLWFGFILEPEDLGTL